VRSFPSAGQTFLPAARLALRFAPAKRGRGEEANITGERSRAAQDGEWNRSWAADGGANK